MTKPLTEDDLATALNELNQDLTEPWVLLDGKLHKTFVLTDFISAFGFMTGVAMEAEKVNHHPDWFNSYKTVKIDLTTHEAGGISEKDFALARAIEKRLNA